MTMAFLFRPSTPTLVLLALVAAVPLCANAQTSATSSTTPTAADTSAVSSAAATAAPGVDVPIYRCNAERNGYVDCAVNLPLSVSWQNTTAPAISNLSSPTNHNGVIFFGAAGTVYAVNQEDGSVKWKYPKDFPLRTGAFDSPATIADGKVFIGNDDGKLYVLDEKTGASLWQYSAGTGIRSAPVVDDGTVFFGTVEGKLFAIKEADQKSLWGGSFKTLGPITTAPILSGGNVYFADGNNTIYAAAEATGRMLWSEKFDYTVVDSPPFISGGTLYFGSDRTMYALSTHTGTQKWRADLSAATSAQAAIAPDAGMVYVPTTDNTVVAMTATRGLVKWIKKLDSVATSAPTVARNVVIVISKAGIITGLDSTTGATKWVYSLHPLRPPFQMNYSSDKGHISTAPLVAGGSVYTLGNEGTLTAFQPNAVDNLKPGATLLSPRTDTAVAGAQVPYLLYVADIGSGIDPSSLTLKVDGVTLPVEYLPLMDEVRVKQNTSGQLFGELPVKLDTLTDGEHHLTIHVSDWRGNLLVKSWNFTVDSTLNPRDAAPPPAGASTPDTTTDDSSADTDNSTPSAPTASGTGSSTDSGGGVPSASGSGVAPSAPSTGGGGGGATTPAPTTPGITGGTTGASGGGGVPTVPPPPAPPVAPPPAAGGGFPPPPPI